MSEALYLIRQQTMQKISYILFTIYQLTSTLKQKKVYWENYSFKQVVSNTNPKEIFLTSTPWNYKKVYNTFLQHSSNMFIQPFN